MPEAIQTLEARSPYLEDVGPLQVLPALAGVRLQALVEARHLNGAGTAHGGFLLTLVDAACGEAVSRATDGGVTAATVSLASHMLSPVKPGNAVVVHAIVDRLTRSLAFVTARAETAGETVLTASAVFRHGRPAPQPEHSTLASKP